MIVLYERIKFKITEFDTEDVITTSGVSPEDPTTGAEVGDNEYVDAGDIGGGTWF